MHVPNPDCLYIVTGISPLHFDVTPSAECVLTAIPTHSSVLYVQTARAPMHPHPACFLFLQISLVHFPGPKQTNFCAAMAQEGAAWPNVHVRRPKCVLIAIFCPNSCPHPSAEWVLTGAPKLFFFFSLTLTKISCFLRFASVKSKSFYCIPHYSFYSYISTHPVEPFEQINEPVFLSC